MWDVGSLVNSGMLSFTLTEGTDEYEIKTCEVKIHRMHILCLEKNCENATHEDSSRS